MLLIINCTTYCLNCKLQDPEIKAHLLWEGMSIVRPWDEIPAEVMAMEPHIFEQDDARNGRLSQEQKEILQVQQMLEP